MDISKLKVEDQYLISYMNLNILRNEGKIDPNGLNELFRIASLEPRAQALEIKYNDVLCKRCSIEEYNALYEKYKSELGEVVNNVPKQANNELLYYNSLLDYLNLEAKKSINPLSKEEEERYNNYLSIVTEAATLEEANSKLNKGEININVFRQIREKYKTLVLQKLKENGRNINEITIKDGNLYKEKSMFINPSNEIEGMVRYFNLEIKRAREGLTASEKNEIFKLSLRYQNAMTLEEAHKRLDNKAIPISVLNLLRDKYKKDLYEKLILKGLNPSELIADDTGVFTELNNIPKEVKIDTNTSQGLTTEEKDFAKYLSIVDKKELTKADLNEILRLRLKNQKAMTLEEAKRRVKEEGIPEVVHTTLYNKYKTELINSIKSKGLNPDDYISVKEEKKEEPIKEEIIETKPDNKDVETIESLREENRILKEKLASLENKLKSIIDDIN